MRRLREDCRFDRAEELIARCLAGHPGNPEARQELGRLRLEQDRAEDGLRLYAGLLADDGQPEELRQSAAAWRIACLDRLFRYDEAFAAAEEACVRFPGGRDVLRATARLYAGRRRYEEALEFYERGLRDSPNDAAMLGGRLGVLGGLGRWDEARTRAVEAARSCPEDPELLADCAETLSKAGDGGADRAVALVDQALRVDPEHGWALEVRVRVLATVRRWGEAEQAVADGLAVRSRLPGLLGEAARVALARGDVDGALAYARRATALDPHHAEARWREIAALKAAGRQAEAVSTAESFLTKEPADPHRWGMLASTVKARDPEKALHALDRGLHRDPDLLQLLCARCSVLVSLRRWEEADAAALHACETHPAHPGPWIERGWIASYRGRTDEALAAFATALSRDPRSYAALYQEADTLLYAHRWTEAETSIRAFRDLYPYYAVPHVLLGRLRWAQDRDDEALAAFETAVRTDPWDGAALAQRVAGIGVCGRLQEAREVAEETLRRRPHDIALHIQLARAQANLGRREEALATIDAALAIDPGDDDALEERLELLLALKRMDEADTAARTLLAAWPLDSWALLAAAREQSARNRPEGALGHVESALVSEPGNPTALDRRVSLLQTLGRLDEAVQAGCAAVALLPERADLRVRAAAVLTDRGRPEEALGHYDHVLRRLPEHLSALRGRVQALICLRRWDEAEESARQAVTRLPDSAVLRVALGEVLDGRHRTRLAVEEFATALRLAPDWDRPYALAMSALVDLGRFAECDELARTAVARCGNTAAVHVFRGQALGRRWHTEEALAAFDEALALAPDNEWALRNRTGVLLALRRWEEAERTGRAAVAADPEEGLCHVVLASVYDRTERWAECLAACERAVAARPYDPYALRRRGEALRRLRRWPEAEARLREAIRLRPDDPDLRLGLTSLLDDRHREEEALVAVEEALRLDPDGLWALRFRGYELRELGRHAEATELAQQVVDRHPEWPDAHFLLATALDEEHCYRAALAEWEQGRKTAPHDVEALVGMSGTLRALHCYAEAELLVRDAWQQQPHNWSLGAELATVLWDRGACDAAVELLEGMRRKAVGPRERATIVSGIGEIELARGHESKALRLFEEAARLDPLRMEDYAIGQAWARVRLGGVRNLRAADRLCRTALEDASADGAGSALVCRGMVAYREERMPEAEVHFRQAITVCPYGAGHTDLGALLVQLARYDEAEPVLERAVELDEYNIHALVELGNLHLRRAESAGGSEDAPALAERAVTEFRRARQLCPDSRSAAIGLCLSLTRASGALGEAEDVLRTALRRNTDRADRQALHLALARLLLYAGDTTKQNVLYEDALDEAVEAMRANAADAEASYVAGLAEQKLAVAAGDPVLRARHRSRAVAHFRSCDQRAGGHVEAQRARRVLDQESVLARAGRLGSVVLVAVSALILLALWADFLTRQRVTVVMVSTLTPVLIGLMVLGLVVPFLERVKLPGGMEADLGASLRQIAQGPAGEANPVVLRVPSGSGPMGELPRTTPVV
ncbi:tetratricopeptide repeat protein [Streptomyces olivaceiscleroticus]|uniref:Tetratricopeptide repeat protein n=1 Tax=Streptomyces olivaceiscleroticus TaxID=68245 RepID=A0ABN1AE86_9ACTN